jgi:hypothetical protein
MNPIVKRKTSVDFLNIFSFIFNLLKSIDHQLISYSFHTLFKGNLNSFNLKIIKNNIILFYSTVLNRLISTNEMIAVVNVT